MSPTILDRITVEVLLPAAGLEDFILNESQLDGWVLADRDLAHQWVPIEAEARLIETHRGGTLLDIASTMEVGTLTVQLVDPPQVRIRPSTPIRVRTTTGTVLFTGNVENYHTSTQRPTLTETYTLVTITAVDAVNTLANTMRYGAVVETSSTDDDESVPFSYETFEARADRLMRRTGLPYEIAPNDPITVFDLLWTRDFLLPTQEAVYALWRTSEHVSLHSGVAFDRDGIRLGHFGEGRLAPGRTHHPGETYIAFPLPNLNPGSTYRITGAPRVSTSVDGVGQAAPAGFGIVGIGHTVVTPIGPRYPLAEYEFVATATTHEVMITLGETLTIPPGTPENSNRLGIDLPPPQPIPGQTGMFSLTLIEQRMPRGQQWFCQSIVYESNLVNHLDLCVNTVRGRWWVDRHGTVRFAREEGTVEPLLEFSDAPGVGLVSYVGVESAEDTARIVNTVTLQNHGRTVDPESGPMADNTTITAQDVTSVATNGPRGADVPTSIYDPPFPELAHYGAGQELARSYTTAYATSEERISALRVHVTPDLTEPMAALDVYDPVDATHRDTTTQARVMSIAHTITPHHWHTNLTLVER